MLRSRQETTEKFRAPLRVLPGRLSVSRTFGDIDAKLTKYEGNPEVVIAVPEICSFHAGEDTDFLLVGCDGIFDRLSTIEAGRIVWETARVTQRLGRSIHEICGECAKEVMRRAMRKRSSDNLTVVLIAFEGFGRSLGILPAPKSGVRSKYATQIAMRTDRSSTIVLRGRGMNRRQLRLVGSVLKEKRREADVWRKMMSLCGDERVARLGQKH